MRIKKPRGTRDFPAREMEKREYVENIIISVIRSYNYKRVLTPTFEHVELFELKSGEEIQEHLYVFEDKSGRRLCLRPEATASVCRMFAEELRSERLPLKLFYSCPMFRYERPQKGRYREFWQIGVELIGTDRPEADAEVISIAVNSLKKLGLEFTLEIGHLGVLRALMNELGIKREKQDHLITLIDKKDTRKIKKCVKDKTLLRLIELRGDKKIMDVAESILIDYNNTWDELKNLKSVLSWLDVLGMEYTIDLGIARGLEYYTGMVFEIRVPDLGAQNQICGGGRYDNLIELFSGINVPASGFAFGFDRVMEALEFQSIHIPKRMTDVVIAPVNEDMQDDAMKIASQLREYFTVDMDLMGRKLNRIIGYADEMNSRYVIIIGPEDMEEEMVTVRDMKTREQKKVRIEDILQEITQ